MFRAHGRARRIREQMQILLTTVASDSAARGAWLELQQCELWAARARIPFRLIYTGPMNPLPSRQGYRQLGYALAESMATRDAMAAGESVDDKELHERIADIAQLGASAELWKLSLVARRTKGRIFLTRDESRQAVRAWRTCEYTFWLRFFLLLRP
jgi:hypothetical protein